MSANEIFAEIIKKYERKDNEINEELKKIEDELRWLKSIKVTKAINPDNTITKLSPAKNLTSLEDLKQRNKEIIKEITIVKARLRSRAIYNPAEITWCSIMHYYKNEPSLPGIEWQCCVHPSCDERIMKDFNN